jgi:hypothetical protein
MGRKHDPPRRFVKCRTALPLESGRTFPSEKGIVAPTPRVSVPETTIVNPSMKNLYLPLIVSTVLLLANVARADTFDSDAATVQKKTDTSATVLVDKSSYVVPVTFGDSASWDNVQDHYDLSDASVALIKTGKAKLEIDSDSSLHWSKK